MEEQKRKNASRKCIFEGLKGTSICDGVMAEECKAFRVSTFAAG